VLRLEDFVKIRELHFKDGWGIKKIARECRYARATVRKAIREPDVQSRGYTLSRPRPRPATTPELCEFVRGILVADKTAPRKQRHTAKRIFKRLRKEKPQWTIGESTHTPASYDFGSAGDRADPQWDAWVKAAVDQGCRHYRS
jgi:hypothetical protein